MNKYRRVFKYYSYLNYGRMHSTQSTQDEINPSTTELYFQRIFAVHRARCVDQGTLAAFLIFSFC